MNRWLHNENYNIMKNILFCYVILYKIAVENNTTVGKYRASFNRVCFRCPCCNRKMFAQSQVRVPAMPELFVGC